ncbi:MAG: hypothetical protein K2W94_07910 [Alphaproteobacteria bacterium]|nr:hypothetical protein [Alphaproteobacteria bacterium]
MKKTILLSAIILPLFIGSASANIVVDEAAEIFHKTTLAVGSAIDKTIDVVSEILGLHSQKVSPSKGHTLTPSEIFEHADVAGMIPQTKEDSSLIFASVYPELVVPDVLSSAQKLSNKGSVVLMELKKQEEKEALTAYEYTNLENVVSQNASSAVPYLVDDGKTKSAVIDLKDVTFNETPHTEEDALLAKMVSSHSHNPNSTLLSKAVVK